MPHPIAKLHEGSNCQAGKSNGSTCGGQLLPEDAPLQASRAQPPDLNLSSNNQSRVLPNELVSPAEMAMNKLLPIEQVPPACMCLGFGLAASRCPLQGLEFRETNGRPPSSGNTWSPLSLEDEI